VPEYYCIAGDHWLIPIGDRYDMRDPRVRAFYERFGVV